jgi:thioredoxin reductase
VAVIGSGPAGLAAAHFLRRLGHGVTVFDAAPEPGGMLRYGIPAYRLPREVLARDIELLAGEGIELRLGKALGRDLTLAGLRDAGFAAVLLAVGAGAPKPLPVDGANLNGVHLGVDFLREAASGSVPAGRFAGQAVAVIGGGNVAVDAARTARRLGASQVTLACLEAADEMPAYPEEIKAAAAEGVRILDSWGVGEILGSDGSVRGLRLVRCASVFDEAGRFAPKLDQGTSREIEANAVIIAIGQAVERGFAEGCDPGFEFRSDGFLAVSPEEMEAGAPGVFACGDLCLGPSSVVQSIASGRKAAESIDRFLGGSGEIASILGAEEPEQRLGRDEGFAARARAVVSEVPPAERIGGFSEVELTLEACAARIEAGRCLQCDLRLLLSEPTPPPVLWLELTEEALSKVPDVEGVYQLLGDDRSVMRIAGAPNLREALERELARDPRPPYFVFQEDPMFTKRESELIQQFLAQHGHMPEGDGEMDDLF